MKPPRFDYLAPRSLDEALAMLAQHGEEAKVLAGGQSLVPLLNMRLATPERLVDLNRVAELAYVTERAGGLAIGAMTRQRAVERSELAALRDDVRPFPYTDAEAILVEEYGRPLSDIFREIDEVPE